MDSKPNVVFEEFEVPTEWVHQVADDALIAYLPGFRNEQLKVQVSTEGILRISGERSIGGNKISRFFKEFPIPSNCDQNKIRANFNGGMLHIKFPQLIIQADENHQEQTKTSADSDQKPANKQKYAAQEAPPMAAPHPSRPAADDTALKQNDAVQQAPPPMAAMEKQTGDEKTNWVAMETNHNVSEKAPDNIEGWDLKEKQENLGDSSQVQDVAEKETLKPRKLDSIDKYQTRINMNKGLNNPRKFKNIVLAVMSAVVLAVYLRNAIRCLWN